jgi:uncharacterized protein (TIGR03000 family)
MLRKKVAFGGALLVAAALVFLTPGPSQARPHGGFGGFHGGAHFGGLHYGGAHFGGFHYGGFHPYYNHLGYRPFYHNYGYYHYGRRPYYGYGYAYNYLPYLFGYGYYPYNYNYYPYNYYTTPYYGSDLGSAYDPTYLDGLASTSVGGGADLPVYSSSSSPTPTDTTAHLTAHVPAGARLWFDDTPTTATGAVRTFHTPALTPGTPYHYDVRATWSENGHEVTQTQHVKVTAGAHVEVDFPLPPKTTGHVAAAPNR